MIVRVSDYPLPSREMCEEKGLGYEIAIIDGSGRYLHVRKVCRVFVDDHEVTGYTDMLLDARAVIFRRDTAWVYIYEKLYEEED